MKRNKSKKILIGAITIIFCLTIFGFIVQSHAEDEVTVTGTWDVSADDGASNVTATLYSDGSFIVSGTGTMVDYLSSSSRPYNDYVADIKTVQIQSGVTSIGYDAFSGCSSLTSIEISEGVTSIGGYAFYECSSLTSIEISEGVTSIGGYAFYGCSSLTSIEIPSSVTSIGNYAFSGCSSLTSIEVDANNSNYSSEDGVLFDKNKTELIQYPVGKQNIAYTIPEGVTSIGDDAFCGCSSLTSIEILEGVTSIGSGAFYRCSSLTSIAIPEGVTSIEYSTFSRCSSLTSIEIPEGVTSIRDSAFSGCSSLTSIEIPDSVTSIGYDAFIGCSSLTSIEIPSSVTSIGNYAFYGCSSLTSIEIPEGVTSIGYDVFCGCSSLTSIIIPEGVTNIGDYAFRGCSSLTSIEIPSSVTSIGNYAFYGCSSLTSIEIPSSVTSIGNYAFYGCSSLTSIEVDANNSNYSSEDGVLFDKNKTELIQYPVGKQNIAYTIPEGVTSIESDAFKGCSSLTSIEIPEGVTSIGRSVFKGCSSLTSIEIPEGVMSIGDYAFHGCSSLTSIEMPSSVTSIGDEAFYECSSLTSIEIPKGVTSIGDSVFYRCSSLTSIEIPEGVTSIGYEAFNECSSLTSIEIPEGVTSIGGYAFHYCSSLTSIEIPEGVTSIGKYAFFGCRSLTSIEIPSSVTSIGKYAFYGPRLTMVVATESETEQEMELPDIIKRTMDEEDILYTANDFTLTNCSLSEDKTKLVVNTEVASTKTVSLEVTEGALNGLTVVVVVPPGTITYSTTSWTNGNVTARIYVADGENIQNNEGNNTYTFTENGNFTFKHLTAEGEEKEATATVSNIDKTNPTISSVTGNPTQWTKENVTLTVTAQDTVSGLATQAYSFDGGQTWQAENTKTYTENTDRIVIKVRDKAGNIATYDTINITKIEKVTSIIISKAPTKTVYLEGEDFDSTGMEVNANYNSQNTETITNYTIIDGDDLKVGQTTVTISYTENGVTKTTSQAITIEAKLNITISGYETTQENGTKYIEGIKLGTTIQGVLNNIETNGTAKVYKDTTRITDGNTKTVTGMTIKISLGTQEETYTIVVTGDLNGNGQMGNVDLLKLVRYNAGLDINLSGAYLKAADIYKDGRYADNKDILKMARVLANLENL